MSGPDPHDGAGAIARISPEPIWHAHPANAVLCHLESRPEGLADDEAARRLAEHGPNRLPEAAPRGAIARFLAQFNAILLLLLASAVVAMALRHWIDAVVIVGVVIINAIVSFIQEGKAERALAAIRDMAAPHASVLRDGRRRSLPAHEIVPGDVVVLEAGDRVPADLRLVRARGLTIDEAVLTGESVPAEKTEAPVAADAPLGDRVSMAFSGTLVAAGQGAGVVVATGEKTEIGRISALIGAVRELTTPLIRQIDRLGRGLSAAIIGVSVGVFLFAVFVRSFAWDEALMAVVGMAVAAIPEGLPAVMTITLAIGVQRMARRNAIIRHLPAVETLGATSVICSDKTGTLTRNEMTVRRIITAAGAFAVSGGGYGVSGGFHQGADLCGAPVAPASLPPAVRALVRVAVLCNDAEVHGEGAAAHVSGDPMEGALVVLAEKAGLCCAVERTAFPRRDEIPFDARHRFMATLTPADDGGVDLLVKGAPEQVLALCSAEEGAGGPRGLDPAFWAGEVAAAAANGERVLGFAIRRVEDAGRPLRMEDVTAGGFLFLGLVGLIDPPRDEAIAAVAECRSAGIAVKMITGDHAATALAIARQLHLADDPQVLTGAALDAIPDADLPAVAVRTSVFARTSPEHKLRIVRALQSTGAVVAMTGDGVNDAPSLKQADVGVAMGKKGTEAAKEASQMVLADDNFASIVAAVKEGRTVYDNLRKMIAWTLPTNGGEALTIIGAILIGHTLPLTAAQILWINMLLTVTLGLVFAFEPAEPDLMRRPPRSEKEGMLSPFLVWRVGFVSVLFMLGAFGIFHYAEARGLSIEVARTMVVNVIVVMEIFYLFAVRYMRSTSLTLTGAKGTTAVLIAIGIVTVAQFAFTYVPLMQMLFRTAAVPLVDGIVVVLVGPVMMLVLEAEKAILRRTRLMRVG